MMGVMTKRITHDLTYDAPLDAVAAMLGDPAFREAVCDAQRVLERDVTIEPVGAGPKRVVLDQVQAAKGMPSFATKIVGDTLKIVQEETWASAADRATLEIRDPGQAGRSERHRSPHASRGGTTTDTVELDDQGHPSRSWAASSSA